MNEIKPFEDGITHINIYTKGKTELGKMLSNLYTSKVIIEFEDEKLEFKTIEGFWYFLIIYYGTKEKDYKFMEYNGFKAKEEGRKKIKENNINSREISTKECFKNKITKAIKEKVKQNKNILTELTYSELKFKHYYFYGEERNAKVIEKNEYNWIIEIYDEIREKMKEFLKNQNS